VPPAPLPSHPPPVLPCQVSKIIAIAHHRQSSPASWALPDPNTMPACRASGLANTLGPSRPNTMPDKMLGDERSKDMSKCRRDRMTNQPSEQNDRIYAEWVSIMSRNMSGRMPDQFPDALHNKMSDSMSEYMSKYMSDKMSGCTVCQIECQIKAE